ncbi:hypothetical protein IFM89_036410 [Coptis chinensis]|uniref:Glutaredoxin domain-containing protein n=1 Tax=Coptis chinensis TaxID=261450 RepID=A0A835II19_9MAGN|nr:hypothetical protein IFM89_036410 [Coptis chinensis]
MDQLLVILNSLPSQLVLTLSLLLLFLSPPSFKSQLHGQFLNELREMLGERVSVPRLFIKGRYIGGVDETIELNELGRLNKLLNAVGRSREPGSDVCEGCGGPRFVPCLECG